MDRRVTESGEEGTGAGLPRAHGCSPGDGGSSEPHRSAAPPGPGEKHRGHPSGPLSAREQEVARLVARGLTNAEIGWELGVSTGTVANHVDHILRKLGLRSRSALAAWAVDADLHEVEERYFSALERLLDLKVGTPAALGDRAASVIADAFAIDKVDIFVLGPDGESLISVGSDEAPLRRAQRALGLARLPLDQDSRVADVFRTGGPYRTGRAELDPLVREGFRRGMGFHSLLAVPLEVDGARRGVVLLQSYRIDAFSQRDERFARTLGCWVASVLRALEMKPAEGGDGPSRRQPSAAWRLPGAIGRLRKPGVRAGHAAAALLRRGLRTSRSAVCRLLRSGAARGREVVHGHPSLSGTDARTALAAVRSAARTRRAA